MIKIPKETIIEKITEQSGLSEKEINSRVKDKLDKLSGLISEEGALHIIANELGVKIFEAQSNENMKVKDVLAGMRNVNISGKVVRVFEVRNFETQNRKGKVGAFLVGDETGLVRIVLWNDKADLLETLSEGKIIDIENGYSRENQGRVEIHVGDKTTIKMSDADPSDINVPQKKQLKRKKISELKDNEEDIEILGTIVQVFDPRFFPIDPETNKKVTEKDGNFYLGEKMIENPDYAYVSNIFLDDGTENIRVVLWRNQVQRLFNMSHEDILKNRDTGFEDMKNDLLGKIVKFIGRTHKNEMFDRIEFVPQIVETDPNPEEEIRKMEEARSAEKKEEAKTASLAKKEGAISQPELKKSEEVIEETDEEESEVEEVEETTIEIDEEEELKKDSLEGLEDLSDLDDI